MRRLDGNGDDGPTVVTPDHEVQPSPQPPIWHNDVLIAKHLVQLEGRQPVPTDLLFIIVVEEKVLDRWG